MNDVTWVQIRPFEQAFVRQLNDRANRVDDRRSYVTDFLTPREQVIAEHIARANGLSSLSFGGYEQAERRRVLFYDGREEDLPGMASYAVSCLMATSKRGSAPLRHSDYLGSLLGLGIKRDKLGDLVLFDGGVYAFCTADMAGVLLQEWSEAGRTRLTVRLITAIHEHDFTPPSIEKLTVTMQSLRLDALVAHAFSLSRTKVVEPIKAGLVQLNFTVCSDPAAAISPGDVLSFRGHGRARVVEIGGNSRSGRIFVTIGRYR